MRTGRIGLMRLMVVAVVVLLAVGAGCGGGGGTAASSIPFSLPIHWAARTRSINAPSAALSVRVTLVGAAPDGGNTTFVVNRIADPPDYTAGAVSPTNVRPGIWVLKTDFYALADAKGSLVATADVEILLRPGEPVLNPDGTPLGAVATASTINNIDLARNQRVAVGGDLDLVTTAFGLQGEVIAVTPGSFGFTVEAGRDKIQLDAGGHVRGLKPGIAAVSVVFEGVERDLANVFVLPSTLRSVALAANDLAYDPISKKLYASVPSTAGAGMGNSIAVIDPATGNIEATIPVGGTIEPEFPIGGSPGRIALSDDGQFLYVALTQPSAVQRISLANRRADLLISPGISATYGIIRDIAAVPGSARALVVVVSDTTAPDVWSRIAVFDDGVRRLDTVDSPYNGAFAALAFGADAQHLYAMADYDLLRLSIGAGGVTLVERVPQLLGVEPRSIRARNGRVYCGNGLVVDPEAKSVVGDLKFRGTTPPIETPMLQVAPDIAGMHALTVIESPNYDPGVAVLRSYRIDTLVPDDNLALPTPPVGFVSSELPRFTSIVPLESGGVAFAYQDHGSRAGDRVVIVSGLPQ